MFERLQPHQQTLKPEGPTVKEGIALVLAVPFIIVSTYFGVSAVNFHFEQAERQIVQQERDAEQRNRASNLRLSCASTFKDHPDALAECLKLR